MPDGSLKLDIRAQTKAVIQKFVFYQATVMNYSIQAILQAAGADLENIVDMTCFLVNMDDYAGFNETYNQFFQKETGTVKDHFITITGRSFSHNCRC